MRLINEAYLTISDFLKGGRRAISPRGKMCPNESSYLLGKSGLEAVRINITDSDKRGKSVLNREDYEYYEARPLWIKIRLCLFWLFWGAFVTVIVLFVFIYWCIVPALCHSNVVYSV